LTLQLKTIRSVKFLFTGPLILAFLVVVNVMTSPGHWWVKWAALGIGIAWIMSLIRVIFALVLLGEPCRPHSSPAEGITLGLTLAASAPLISFRKHLQNVPTFNVGSPLARHRKSRWDDHVLRPRLQCDLFSIAVIGEVVLLS